MFSMDSTHDGVTIVGQTFFVQLKQYCSRTKTKDSLPVVLKSQGVGVNDTYNVTPHVTQNSTRKRMTVVYVTVI